MGDLPYLLLDSVNSVTIIIRVPSADGCAARRLSFAVATPCHASSINARVMATINAIDLAKARGMERALYVVKNLNQICLARCASIVLAADM